MTLVDQGDGTFAPKISGQAATAAGGAPSTADYIVKTANAGLSAEVAIGAGTAGQILQSDGTNPTYTSMGTTAAAVGTSAGGSATTASKSDHVHATGAGTPSTQAFGDAAATGTGPAAAMTDHKHAMPALGTTAAAIGTSAGGSAVTPSKSDHVHATGAGTPAAVSTANATGTGPAAAMTDHVHAHEAAHIAHDTIWDAAGDMVIGSGADAAGRLAIGAAGGHPTVINGVIAYNSGTAFPSPAAAGDRFWRTDIENGTEFFNDGTRWRSIRIYELYTRDDRTGGTADLAHWSPTINGATDLWLIDFRWVYNVASGHTTAAYWTCALKKYDNTTDTTVVTLTTDKATTTWNAPTATSIGALLGLTNKLVRFALTKVGTPGSSVFGISLRYQIVAT